jgi:hypothetical protein
MKGIIYSVLVAVWSKQSHTTSERVNKYLYVPCKDYNSLVKQIMQLPGKYVMEIIGAAPIYLCTKISIMVLLLILKNGKQLECPMIERSVK